MRKLHPEQYNGTEYIRLSNLPLDQMIHLNNWVSDFAKFSIHIPDGTIQNCVYYEDYEFWFDNYKCENLELDQSLF